MIEKPLFIALPSVNEELWTVLTSLNDQEPFELPPIWHLAALCSISQLDEVSREACLDKWVPDPYKEAGPDVLRVLEYIETDIDANLYEKMLMVWRYNSFGHHTEAQGLVIYNKISMMAHSCAATACWHYGVDDAFVLRARVSLQTGSELTISYIGDDELFKSTLVRREKVQGWLFLCQCDRCVLNVDLARGFRCPCCGTGTTFYKTENQITISQPCTMCHTIPNPETIEQYVSFEKAYADRLYETNKSDMPDAEMVFEQASRVFTQHWILYQLHTILFEGYRAASEIEAAIHHQQQRIAYVSTIMPHASYSLAWMYEEMGDIIQMNTMGPDGAPKSSHKLKIAGRHFEDAYNLLSILCGIEHDYTITAANKRRKVDEICPPL